VRVPARNSGASANRDPGDRTAGEESCLTCTLREPTASRMRVVRRAQPRLDAEHDSLAFRFGRDAPQTVDDLGLPFRVAAQVTLIPAMTVSAPARTTGR
jgi:hypothetical protein